MDRNSEKLLSLIKEGQRILGEEEKIQHEKAMMKKLDNIRAWRGLYLKAVSGLPREISKYLQTPDGMRDGQQCIPVTVANYYNWQLKIMSMVPIEVRFSDGGQPCGFIVPLAEPSFESFNRETVREFTGEQALERALAFAVDQTLALRKIKDEQERRFKEYEEQEALAAKEPKYEPVDGSEPVPDLVLVNGVRRMIQEELKKAGVLS